MADVVNEPHPKKKVFPNFSYISPQGQQTFASGRHVIADFYPSDTFRLILLHIDTVGSNKEIERCAA